MGYWQYATVGIERKKVGHSRNPHCACHSQWDRSCFMVYVHATTYPRIDTRTIKVLQESGCIPRIGLEEVRSRSKTITLCSLNHPSSFPRSLPKLRESRGSREGKRREKGGVNRRYSHSKRSEVSCCCPDDIQFAPLLFCCMHFTSYTYSSNTAAMLIRRRTAFRQLTRREVVSIPCILLGLFVCYYYYLFFSSSSSTSQL